MTFSRQEIIKLENPYQDLGNSDALAEHASELDKLSDEEMNTLASRMILSCPKQELNTFGHALNALKSSSKEPQFHPVIYQAYEVKKRLLALSDPRNNNPHLLLLDEELNEEGFQIFNEMALKIVANNESAIAERLALTTPEKKRSALAQNVKNLFPNSDFASRTAAAFTLRRDIDRLLLGDNPEQFFSSPEFSVDLCLEFSTLLSTCLAGQEQTIGKKLAELDSPIRHDICLKLERMTVSALDQNSPFKLITSALMAKVEPQINAEQKVSKEASSPGTNSQGMFHYKQNPATSTNEKNYSSDSESTDEDEETCVDSYCGLFDCKK